MPTTTSRLSRIARKALPAAPLALIAVPSAHAVIIYTPANVTMSFADGQFLWVDMGTGGSPGAAALGPQDRYHPTITSPSFYLFFRYNSGGPEWVSNDGAVSPGRVFDGNNNAVAQTGISNTVRDLALGTTIDGSLNLGSNYSRINRSGINDAQWAPGTTGYIGVEFNTNTSPLFGWVQLSYNLDQSITVHDFAYESSGGAIGAGIPEPATTVALAGLLAGSAALYAKRRRTKQVA